MNADINKYIEDFKSQIVELEALRGQTPTAYVVKVGPLWIKFDRGFKNPRAVGVAGATYMGRGDAYRVGKWVQNGGGSRGVPQLRDEAIDEQIASLKASIEFFGQMPKAN
jgi:hypothetical protein